MCRVSVPQLLYVVPAQEARSLWAGTDIQTPPNSDLVPQVPPRKFVPPNALVPQAPPAEHNLSENVDW
eukprot:gene2835-biopygen11697